MAIVQRPLAAIIAPRSGPVLRPRDLEGRTVGVTGLPSDEAVVDSELEADGGDPDRVHRVTIGFNAVSQLAAGRVDAATGFWNAEAVALARRGVPNRVFKVNRYGAPPYPELVLAASQKTIDGDPGLVDAVVRATTRGYAFAYAHPAEALDDLLASVPSLERGDQTAQLAVLRPDLRPAPLDPAVLRRWAAWDLEHGLLERPLDVSAAFRLPG
jgi:NitT/TauT family transport system substrate-binding protein/putative hydroxymethylpyrimidine transport system substrate-binding protein